MMLRRYHKAKVETLKIEKEEVKKTPSKKKKKSDKK